MRILHVIDSLDLGGAEKFLIDSIKVIKEKDSNLEQVVVTTQIQGGVLEKELNLLNIEYFHFQCSGLTFVKSIYNLRKFIRLNNFNIVHSHLYNSMIIGKIVTPFSVQYCTTYHNLDYSENSPYHSKWRILLDKITYNKNHQLFYVSNAVKKAVEYQFKRGEIGVVLPNFPDTKFKPIYNLKKNESIKLVAIGSFKKVKNFQFLINTIKELNNKKILLDIIGDGPLKVEYQFGIEGCEMIKLLPKQEITSELHNEYDLMIMSSFTEGMPIVLLEAMATGIPCILPDHLSVMEELAGKGAKYFSIQEIQTLKTVLNNIYKDKSQLNAMSSIMKKNIIHFQSDKYLDKLFKFYKN